MDLQSFGRYLRQAREERELTLEQAEQTLRIRRRILESFELGDFELPNFSLVQIYGFIRNYARWLGLDEEQAIEYYEAAKMDTLRRSRRKKDKRSTQEIKLGNGANGRNITDTHPTLPQVPVKAAKSAPQRVTPPPAEMRAERGERGAGVLTLIVRLLVAGAALAVIAFVIFQVLQSTPIGVETTQTAPDILAQLPDVPTFTLAPTATRAQPTNTPPGGQFFSGQGVLVQMTMSQRTWIAVSVDGAQRYQGVARPGDILEYAGTATISVRAANAQALDVVYNGQQQSAFGGRGQRVDIVFTPTDVQISSGQQFDAPTPVASFTPIPTSATDVGELIAALTPSATPGPSPTATDTPPPTDTPTITPTPSITPTASDTPTATGTPVPSPTPGPSPTATAILPPREGLFSPTPTKAG
jgi:transcriptional regulator with XRE-family HTH domain